jgi:hypothetical protein
MMAAREIRAVLLPASAGIAAAAIAVACAAFLATLV